MSSSTDELDAMAVVIESAIRNFPLSSQSFQRTLDHWISIKTNPSKVTAIMTVLVTKLISVLIGDDVKESFIETTIKKVGRSAFGSVRVTNFDLLTCYHEDVSFVLSTLYFLGLFYPIIYDNTYLNYIKARLNEFTASTQTWEGRTPDFSFIQYEIPRVIINGYSKDVSNYDFFIHQQLTDVLKVYDNLDALDHRILASSFTWEFLLMKLHSKEDSFIILESILSKLNHPALEDNEIPYILNTLSAFITICPHKHSDLLLEIRPSIYKYLVWPRPIYTSVRDALSILDKEIKVHNFNMVNTILDENPSLLNPLLKPSKLYFIVDTNVPRTLHFMEYIKSFEENKRENASVKLSIMNNIFLYSGIDTSPLDLTLIKEENLNALFEELISMLIALQKEKIRDAPELFSVQIGPFIEKVVSFQTQTAQYSYPVQQLKMTDLSFQQFWIDSSRTSFTRKRTTEEYTILDPDETPQLELLLQEEYLSVDQDSQDKRKVFLTVCGDSSTIAVLTRALFAVKQGHPEYFDEMDIRLYVIPSSNSCELGKYISYKDALYGARVVSSFNGIFSLVPGFAVGDECPEISPTIPFNSENDYEYFAGIPPSPGILARHLVQNYVRDARSYLTVNNFSCTIESAQGSMDGTLIFCSTINIGYESYLAAVRKTLPSEFEHHSDEELLMIKEFRFNPLQLNIRYKYVTLSGNLSGYRTDSRAFKSINLLNFPMPSEEFTSVAHPSISSLEMLIDTEDGKKKEPRRSFQIGFAEIECTDKTVGFNMTIDGILYKNIKKITINQTNHVLKVMTHIPIDSPNKNL